MTASNAPPQSIDETLKTLADFLAARPSNARRITFVFGAGLSIALSLGETDATWAGLMRELARRIRQRHRAINPVAGGSPYSSWVADKEIEHRFHTINSLTYGDSDSIVASTFLVDRIHGLHERTGGAKDWPELARHIDVNEVACRIETAMVANASKTANQDWTRVLRLAGQKAQNGQALLATTNFDHTLAILADLPVFVGPRSTPFGKDDLSKEFYRPYAEGLIIDRSELRNPDIWHNSHVEKAKRARPTPALYAKTWSDLVALQPHWWRQLSCVFHVHGSRMVPPSMVFDPASYWQMTQTVSGPAGVQTPGRIMFQLFRNPNISGPIVFVGCGGTILDAHFAHYWTSHKTSRHQAIVLATEHDGEADSIQRHLHSCLFKAPPMVCNYGPNFAALPGAVERILNLL
ncbi:MAG: hypothetical protein ACO1TE_30145 [Prosthecobacter sp.]